MAELMSRKTIRLNVLCNSRSKKFLVLGEKESTVLELLASIKKMFLKLYPDESSLEISGVKNQDGFDVFSSYKLGDLFEDNTSLSITEHPTSAGEEIKKPTGSTSTLFHDDKLAEQNGEDSKVQNDDNDDEDDGESSVKKTAEKQTTENLTSFKKSKNEDSDTTSTKKSKTEVISKKNVEDEDDVSPPKETKRSHSESADEQDKKKKRRKKKSGK